MRALCTGLDGPDRRPMAMAREQIAEILEDRSDFSGRGLRFEVVRRAIREIREQHAANTVFASVMPLVHSLLIHPEQPRTSSQVGIRHLICQRIAAALMPPR